MWYENLPCSFLDYVLSTLEFEEFYNLMNDYKKMNNQNLSNEYENIFNRARNNTSLFYFMLLLFI